MKSTAVFFTYLDYTINGQTVLSIVFPTDDRQWDAFISYKSTKADETFVVRKLFPKLEKELGFRVNVHFRDFVPGESKFFFTVKIKFHN